jgi:hypothetical protein
MSETSIDRACRNNGRDEENKWIRDDWIVFNFSRDHEGSQDSGDSAVPLRIPTTG